MRGDVGFHRLSLRPANVTDILARMYCLGLFELQNPTYPVPPDTVSVNRDSTPLGQRNLILYVHSLQTDLGQIDLLSYLYHPIFIHSSVVQGAIIRYTEQ